MAAVWPDYARQHSDGYELTAGATVRRTEFDDGAVRQAPSVSRARARRTLVAEIPGLGSPISGPGFRGSGSGISWAAT